ncbi:MAG: hypothetical protein ACK4UO_18140 [Pseudolabrys sp.]
MRESFEAKLNRMISIGRVLSILLCLTVGTAGIAASVSAGKPGDDGSIVAVFPPWWSASRALTAASDAGAVLGGGGFAFVIIVQAQEPGLGDRLRAAGALLLLNPLGVGGCGPASSGNQNV